MPTDKGKTVKQLADEIGVTKQAIHQKRKSKELSTALQPFTSTVDGVVYISVDGEKLIKQAFDSKDRKHVDANEPTSVYASFTPSVGGENQLYSILQAELESKNKQIESLQTELAKEREHSREQADRLAVFADQSQKLQLAQMHSDNTLPLAAKPSFLDRIFGKLKKDE